MLLHIADENLSPELGRSATEPGGFVGIGPDDRPFTHARAAPVLPRGLLCLTGFFEAQRGKYGRVIVVADSQPTD